MKHCFCFCFCSWHKLVLALQEASESVSLCLTRPRRWWRWIDALKWTQFTLLASDLLWRAALDMYPKNWLTWDLSSQKQSAPSMSAHKSQLLVFYIFLVISCRHDFLYACVIQPFKAAKNPMNGLFVYQNSCHWIRVLACCLHAGCQLLSETVFVRWMMRRM